MNIIGRISSRLNYKLSVPVLIFITTLAFATGPSSASVCIIPVAETQSGQLICKWQSQVNATGAYGMIMPYHLGWIGVDSSGIQIELETKILSNEYEPLLSQDSICLAQFYKMSTIEDIPEELRNWCQGNIRMIEIDSSFNRQFPLPHTELPTVSPLNNLYSIKGLRSDSDYYYGKGVLNTYEEPPYKLYSSNGIELIHCSCEDQFINGVFFQGAQSIIPFTNNNDEDATTIDYYYVDAFRFKGDQ